MIIKFLKTNFSKYADSINVLEDFFKNENLPLKWKCANAEHRMDIFSKIFVLFITMRMRQQSYAKNIECKKLNRTKKHCQNWLLLK